MEYKDLKHFELVHGKAFVFILEQLDKRLGSQVDKLQGEENERLNCEKIQLQQSTEQLHKTPRTN